MPNFDMMMDQAEHCRIMKRHMAALSSLATTTHFGGEELESLLIIYHKLTRDGPMDRKLFRQFLHTAFQMTNDTCTDRIFMLFDADRRYQLKYETWVQCLSVLLRGTLDEMTKLCFSIYDLTGTGQITKEQMLVFLKKSMLSRQDDMEEGAKDLCEVIVKKMDLDRDGKVNFADFKDIVNKNKNMVEALGPCIPSRKSVFAFMSSFSRNMRRY